VTKRVLFLAYFFPPHPSSGSNRSGALVQYLEKYGWDVTVVTKPHPDRNRGDSVIEVPDPGALPRLLSRTKTDLQINETISNKPTPSPIVSFGRRVLRRLVHEIVYYPDPFRNWGKSVLQAVQKQAHTSPYDIVLSSSLPETSHLIARKIKQQGLARYWVADFRDLWTQNHYRTGKHSLIRNNFERRLEIYTLRDADLLVTISSPCAQTLSELHNKHVEVITNGFVPTPRPDPLVPSPQFTIVFTGQLYQGKRDPTLLFEAIRALKQQNVCNPGEIRIRFFGENPAWLADLVNTHHLSTEVELCGRVSRQKSHAEQRQATVLLNLNWDHPSEIGTYTGKIFEYLNARRPILAVGGPPGVLTELLETTGAGVHPQSLEELKNIIVQWLKEFRETGQVAYHGKETEIQQYSWENLAKRYAGLLDSLSLTK